MLSRRGLGLGSWCARASPWTSALFSWRRAGERKTRNHHLFQQWKDGQTLETPSLPRLHTRQDARPEAQGRGQAGVRFLPERGAARASLSLGRTSPQIPGPGRSPGKEEGGSRGGPAGAGHPPPFSASRGAPTIQTGAPVDHGLEGGWARQQKPHDLLPPWHIPCRPDQFPQGLLPTLPLTADLLWVGLLGRPGAVPWGGFSPGLGWCLSPHPPGRGGPQPSQARAARGTRTRILTPNRRAKGPGGPRRGGSATVPTGTPAREDTSGAVGGSRGACSPARTGPAEGRLHSRRAASCGPARPRRRRQDAGRQQGPRGGRRARVGGTTSASPGAWREASGPGPGERGGTPCLQPRPLLRVVRTTPAAQAGLPAPTGA